MTRVWMSRGWWLGRQGCVEGAENLVRAGITSVMRVCQVKLCNGTKSEEGLEGLVKEVHALLPQTVKRTNRKTGASNQCDARQKGSLRETRKP